MEPTPQQRLRGPRLVAAPLTVVGLVGAAFAVATTLWATWHTGELGVASYAVIAVSLAVGVTGFAAARGCFVEPGSDEVRDVVAWITLRRVPRDRVVAARVRDGAWRWFELELDDGTLLTLLGASPVQLPARLLPGAREQDLSDLAALGGDDPARG